MPFYRDPNLEEEDRNNRPILISGSGDISGASGNINNGISQGPNRRLNTGSGFQNLDSYLSGNNANEFGNRFISRVQQNVGQAEEAVNRGLGDFEQRVRNYNRIPTAEQRQQAYQHPETQNRDEFRQWMHPRYEGPRSIAETPEIYSRFADPSGRVSQINQNLGTESGRQALVRQFFGRPNYTSGQRNLDSLLFSRSRMEPQTEDIRNRTLALQNRIRDIQNESLQITQRRQNELEASRQQLRQELGLRPDTQELTGGGVIGAERQRLEDQRNALDQQRQQQLTNMLWDLEQRGISRAQANRIGINEPIRLFGANPAMRTRVSEANPNIQSEEPRLTRVPVELRHLPPEQLNRIRALAQLSELNENIPESVIQHEDYPEFNYDLSGLQRDIQPQREAYEREMREFLIPGTVNIPHTNRPAMVTLGSQRDVIDRQANPATRNPNLQLLQGFMNRVNRAENEVRNRHRYQNLLNILE